VRDSWYSSQLGITNATLRTALHTHAEEAAKLIAQRDDLLGLLNRFSGYSQCALDQFSNGRGYLDITGFHSLIKAASEAITKATT
jgi:hypothetical protein